MLTGFGATAGSGTTGSGACRLIIGGSGVGADAGAGRGGNGRGAGVARLGGIGGGGAKVGLGGIEIAAEADGAPTAGAGAGRNAGAIGWAPGIVGRAGALRLASQSSKNDGAAAGPAGRGGNGRPPPAAPGIVGRAPAGYGAAGRGGVSGVRMRFMISASTLALGRPYLAAESCFRASMSFWLGLPNSGIAAMLNG